MDAKRRARSSFHPLKSFNTVWLSRPTDCKGISLLRLNRHIATRLLHSLPSSSFSTTDRTRLDNTALFSLEHCSFSSSFVDQENRPEPSTSPQLLTGTIFHDTQPANRSLFVILAEQLPQSRTRFHFSFASLRCRVVKQQTLCPIG